jgi:uncharacterized protein YceK
MEATLNRLFKIFGIICLTCSAAGCGTFVNTVGFKNEPKERIYGGVRWDVEGGSDNLVRVTKGTETVGAAAASTAVCLIDLPLSIVGDTITLPLVIVRQIVPSNDQESAMRESEKLSGQGGNGNVPEK